MVSRGGRHQQPTQGACAARNNSLRPEDPADTTASLDVGTFLTVAAYGGAALGGLMLALFAWLRSDIRDLRQRLDGFIDSRGPVRPEAGEARARFATSCAKFCEKNGPNRRTRPNRPDDPRNPPVHSQREEPS